MAINKKELTKQEQIKQKAEASLEAFIRLVHPQRMLGHVHLDLIDWWTREEAKSHQLVLLPRDHQKSALVAYRVAWEITRNPTLRVLYISSTSNLAIKQLAFIKAIFESEIYRFYWPEMVKKEYSARAKWTETEIEVDHPLRKKEAVRDPTIFTAGLTTGITGLHCDIAVLDDVVVKENAYTEEGRDKVKSQYSLLSSIEGAEAKEWIVGTRYHPLDLYHELMEMKVDIYDEEVENVVDSESLYEKFERQVEDRGDGTGQFIWPRQQRYDGKWFGFDASVLAKKRAQYLDRVQFKAQYYNDPNDPEGNGIQRDFFQYYDPKYIHRQDGKWYFKSTRLNIFAAVDFAFSLKRRADYSAIVVVGIDTQRNYYVLELERFKTDSIQEYFNKILRLHQKWDFRKIRCEVSAAQKVIVQDLKNNYIRPHGLSLVVDEFTPTRHLGSKEERLEAILQPRYANRQIWHYRGGNCTVLEDELVLSNPSHDDCKDALAAAIDVAIAPTGSLIDSGRYVTQQRDMIHGRFGGVR